MIAAALAWMQIPPRQPARGTVGTVPRYLVRLSGPNQRGGFRARPCILPQWPGRDAQSRPKCSRRSTPSAASPVLATLLQVSPERVARWRTIPAEYAVVIEAKIGL